MRFRYRAIAPKGPDLVGYVDATTRPEALASLTRRGTHPYDLRAVPFDSGRWYHRVFRRTPSKRALAGMFRHIADLLTGGLPLSPALEVIVGAVSHPRLRSAAEEVRQGVESGVPFHRALEAASGTAPSGRPVFSPVVVGVVRAGEESGRLPEVLRALASQLDREHDLEQRIRSALAYPAVLVIASLVAATVLVTWVVPRLELLFAELGQDLPALTSVVIALSGWLARFGGFGLLALGLGVFLLQRRRRSRPDSFWMVVGERTPVLRRFLRARQVASFSRTLSALLASGLSLLDSLEVVGGLASSSLRVVVGQVRGGVEEGRPLSAAMGRSGFFNDSTVRMVAVGEEASDPTAALAHVATIHERDLDDATRLLTTLLEPTLVVLAGLLVAVVVAAMMLPLLQLNVTG